MRTTHAGQQWPSELIISQDSISGATVRQLTSYRAHCNHSYFTYPCRYDNSRKLVIASDRFQVDLLNGYIGFSEIHAAIVGPASRSSRDRWDSDTAGMEPLAHGFLPGNPTLRSYPKHELSNS